MMHHRGRTRGEALPMTASISRGRCPSCQSVLRIPGEWVRQTVRCKRCGATLQAFPKARAPAIEPAANGNGLAAATPDQVTAVTPSEAAGGTELAFDLLTANPALAIARHRSSPPRRRTNWLSAVAIAGLI